MLIIPTSFPEAFVHILRCIYYYIHLLQFHMFITLCHILIQCNHFFHLVYVCTNVCVIANVCVCVRAHTRMCTNYYVFVYRFIKGITLKICMLGFVLINSTLLNLLCVWI